MKKATRYTIISFSILIFSCLVCSAEWYEGGNLHRATVKMWQDASYNNRLATSADWFVSITRSHNPALQQEMDNLSNNQYLSNLKKFSVQLEKCVSDIAVHYNNSEKIAEIASICYISLYVKK